MRKKKLYPLFSTLLLVSLVTCNTPNPKDSILISELSEKVRKEEREAGSKVIEYVVTCDWCKSMNVNYRDFDHSNPPFSSFRVDKPIWKSKKFHVKTNTLKKDGVANTAWIAGEAIAKEDFEMYPVRDRERFIKKQIPEKLKMYVAIFIDGKRVAKDEKTGYFPTAQALISVTK